MRRWLMKHEQKNLPFVVTEDSIYAADFPRAELRQSWEWKSLGRDGAAQVQLAGKSHTVHFTEREGVMYLALDGFFYRLPYTDVRKPQDAQGSLEGARAEIPGRIVKVLVKAGEKVTQGQPLLVQEAMKMEITLRAPANLTIAEVLVTEGAQVDAEALLVSFAPAQQE